MEKSGVKEASFRQWDKIWNVCGQYVKKIVRS